MYREVTKRMILPLKIEVSPQNQGRMFTPGLIEKPAGNNKHWPGPGSQQQLPATKFVQTFCQVFNRIGCPAQPSWPAAAA